MIELIRPTSLDVMLLLITAVYAVALLRLFRAVDKRDTTYTERMRRWHEQLIDEDRERREKAAARAAE
jgi:hypothetical protein